MRTKIAVMCMLTILTSIYFVSGVSAYSEVEHTSINFFAGDNPGGKYLDDNKQEYFGCFTGKLSNENSKENCQTGIYFDFKKLHLIEVIWGDDLQNIHGRHHCYEVEVSIIETIKHFSHHTTRYFLSKSIAHKILIVVLVLLCVLLFPAQYLLKKRSRLSR